jgi:hypothetical protein
VSVAAITDAVQRKCVKAMLDMLYILVEMNAMALGAILNQRHARNDHAMVL